MLTFKSTAQSAQNSNGNSIEVTPAMFFGDNGFKPYFSTREAFLAYGEKLRETEVEDLRSFFQYCKEGLTMDGRNQGKVDRGGRKYLYPKFYRARATPGVKVMIDGEILRFIEDYQKGEISIAFTLDDLIIEARQQN